MKLFDLLPSQKHTLNRFLIWHFGYFIYVTIFFLAIFEFNLFKSHWLLKESGILNAIAPIHTIIFVVISPFRGEWWAAVVNMYKVLDGELVFLIMGGAVFGLGFYLYSILIWLLGGIIPGIIFS